jgi:type IV secretory pathway protease TraF
MADRHYVEPGALLLKPVAATGGTSICRQGARVLIDGLPVAQALPADRFRRPLQSWSGCRKLAADQLFLLAPARRDSFDSRYFGPVNKTDVIGIARPLCTWS